MRVGEQSQHYGPVRARMEAEGKESIGLLILSSSREPGAVIQPGPSPQLVYPKIVQM